MKKLQDKVNVDAPDADFPFGKMRDDTGGGNGTPADTDFMHDYTQHAEKTMDESGVVANGILDNDYTGFQLFEAHSKVFGRKFVKEVTSVFDGDLVTVSQAEIQDAFGGYGFGNGNVVGSVADEFCNLSVSVWYLSAGTWYNMPIASGPGGANVTVNDSTGLISIQLDIAAVDPAVRTRIVIQG